MGPGHHIQRPRPWQCNPAVRSPSPRPCPSPLGTACRALPHPPLPGSEQASRWQGLASSPSCQPPPQRSCPPRHPFEVPSVHSGPCNVSPGPRSAQEFPSLLCRRELTHTSTLHRGTDLQQTHEPHKQWGREAAPSTNGQHPGWARTSCQHTGVCRSALGQRGCRQQSLGAAPVLPGAATGPRVGPSLVSRSWCATGCLSWAKRGEAVMGGGCCDVAGGG